MRSFPLIAVVVLLASSAFAEPPGKPTSERAPPGGKLLPLKGASGANPCATFGPGFVRLEGSDTCVKLGGALDIGAGASAGSRR
jgi:hypothetical protein